LIYTIPTHVLYFFHISKNWLFVSGQPARMLNTLQEGEMKGREENNAVVWVWNENIWRQSDSKTNTEKVRNTEESLLILYEVIH
jgi:hypothetical protein